MKVISPVVIDHLSWVEWLEICYLERIFLDTVKTIRAYKYASLHTQLWPGWSWHWLPFKFQLKLTQSMWHREHSHQHWQPHKVRRQQTLVRWSDSFPPTLSVLQHSGPEKHAQACDAGYAQRPDLLHGAGLPSLALPPPLRRHDEVKHPTLATGKNRIGCRPAVWQAIGLYSTLYFCLREKCGLHITIYFVFIM